MKRYRKVKFGLIFCLLFVLVFISSCAEEKDKTKEPLTLTMWHVYGEQTDSPLNDLIDEFNNTVGRQEGIRIQVAAVSNTSDIHDDVLRAANNEPGADALPDIFVSYPKTVLAMPDSDILVDYKDYFSEDELSQYIPEFIDEGVTDDRLTVFPVAKSTEIMFVNKTLFDRFANETGVTLDNLSTWKGLFETANLYYEKTGKSFFVHDYWFNYFQVGVTSMGEDFFDGDKVVCKDAFNIAYEQMAKASVTGSVWLEGGFATAPLRTGDAIVSVASSASVLYYEDKVTYEDNNSEPVEVIALPVPCFEGAKKMVMQRGAGLCTVKSTPQKEQAAVTFIKWLTSPENNVKFVTSTGYMPVTNEAFNLLPEAIDKLDNPKYKSLYEAYIKTQKEYSFYTAPKFATYLETEDSFEKGIRKLFRDAVTRYGQKEECDLIIQQTYERLVNDVVKG